MTSEGFRSISLALLLGPALALAVVNDGTDPILQATGSNVILGDLPGGTINNTVIFRTNGADRAFFDVAGRFGIGPSVDPGSFSSSANQLVVSGPGNSGITIATPTTANGALYFADGTANSDPYRGFLQYYHDGDKMVLGTSGATRLTINGSGQVGIGMDPRTAFEVNGNGSPSGGLRVTHGFLEVDGVNTNGSLSGGTNNLRIGYVQDGKVGFNMEGLEAASLTRNGTFKLSSTGSNGTLTFQGDSEGAKIVTGKGQGGNRNLRFMDKDFYTGTETEIARFESGGRAVFWNRASVEGNVSGQEAFVVDQRVPGVIAQFRRDGAVKVSIGENGDISSTGFLEVASVRTKTWTVAPDYVFEKDYELRPLDDVDAFVKKNKHLPEIPSAKQFQKQGMDLAEMNFLLLKKVEELTLHAIRQEKQHKAQAGKIKELEKQITSLSKMRKHE